MNKDRYERRPRRPTKEEVEMVANADFNSVYSLAAAMGLVRCLHGGVFPCPQCLANRAWNEAATGKILTAREFEEEYTHRQEVLA